MIRRIGFVLLMVLSSSGWGQTAPRPGPGDPRVQMVTYDHEQVVQLQVAPGYQLTVDLAPDERIENIAVGDSSAWQVTPNGRGDHLFIKPVQGGTTTNLTVVTDARTYLFELSPSLGGVPAYAVRFQYPPSAGSTGAVLADRVQGRFKLTGAKDIRPDAIGDDGEKTYILWRPEQSLPAIFIVDERGQETLANGAVREGRYVIDNIANRLVFRLDHKVAAAIRVPKVGQ